MYYISLIILTLTFEQCKNWIFVNKHIHTHTHTHHLTSPHLTHPTSPHPTSPHPTSPHLAHLTPPHLTSPHPPHFTSHHLTHLTSPHLTHLTHSLTHLLTHSLTKDGKLSEDYDFSSPNTIFECNQNCRCDAVCQNRCVQNGIQLVYIQYIK